MIYFKTPSDEKDYLKGIIRNSNVFTRASSNYCNDNSCATEVSMIQDKYNKNWHSIEDATYRQYAQIFFPYDQVEIESYMFSTGGNVVYFSNSYELSCSNDEKEWFSLDTHTKDNQIKSSQQKIIFNVSNFKRCNIFRFNITGSDSKGRNYGYIGPVEFYGKKYPLFSVRSTCNEKITFHYFMSYCLICIPC